MKNCLNCKHHILDSRLDEVKKGVFSTNVTHKCSYSQKNKQLMFTVKEARFNEPCGKEGKHYQPLN